MVKILNVNFWEGYIRSTQYNVDFEEQFSISSRTKGIYGNLVQLS